MNKSTTLGVIIIVAIALFGAYLYYQSDPGAPSKVELAIGERGAAGGITIGVLELVEDSRCPGDVQCIQAGTVRVRTAINAMNRDFTFTLGEGQVVLGTTITLMSVVPAVKYSTVTVAPADYRFTFSVAKAPPVATKVYTSETYGVSFKYPETYEVSEREVGTALRNHYLIMLTKKSDLPLPQNGEGPPTITIDIFQNNLDKQTLLGWLTGTAQSNYKLGDGTYVATTVDGAEGVAYSWSGLYEADSVAFIYGDNIFMVSGAYLAPDDAIRTDYLNLLATLDLK